MSYYLKDCGTAIFRFVKKTELVNEWLTFDGIDVTDYVHEMNKNLIKRDYEGVGEYVSALY